MVNFTYHFLSIVSLTFCMLFVLALFRSEERIDKVFNAFMVANSFIMFVVAMVNLVLVIIENN